MRERLRLLRCRWPAIVGILRGRQVAYRVKVVNGALVFDEGWLIAMGCRIDNCGLSAFPDAYTETFGDDER